MDQQMQTDFNWNQLDHGKFANEAASVAALLAELRLSPAVRAEIVTRAAALVDGARASARKQGVVESFLKEFSLGTREGLALMCLAEALAAHP